ncbi:MAG: rhodanese-like domain-containing protein [Bacteroidota bacterium]
MIKILLGFLLVMASTFSYAQKQNWKEEQLMDPAQLAMAVTNNKDLPMIVCVGPGANIPGSVNIGMVNDKAGIAKLKKAFQQVPKDRKIVLYCGCCPFEHCPNAAPAMNILQAMNFTNYYLLNLPSNLKKDWIDKGYPTTNN